MPITFDLRAWDDMGFPSAITQCYEVIYAVRPKDKAIHKV